MKTCSKCAKEKYVSEFFVKNKESGRLHAQCKECYKAHRKSYYAEHYKNYGDKYRARAKVRRMRIRRDLQIRLIRYMTDKSCVVCKESDMRVLEFDHLDPSTKVFGIAQGLRNGLNWNVISTEISKCQILCANCHKKRTAEQFGWFKAIATE